MRISDWSSDVCSSDLVKVAQSAAPYRAAGDRKQPRVLAFGASTGGIHAFNIILRGLPESFRLPILVTQQLPQSFIPVFARQIEGLSGRPAPIACGGAETRQGATMVARGMGDREHGGEGTIV